MRFWVGQFLGVDNPDFALCPTSEGKRQFIRKYLDYYLEREPNAEEVERLIDQLPYFEAVILVH